MRLAVLASGRGSNFLAIAEAARSGRIPNCEIAGLICNKPDAPALEIAKRMNIPSFVHASSTFIQNKKLDRAAYEEGLLPLLKNLSPDYVCLAGYMLLLGRKMTDAFPNRILNIHPSLLPAFKGLHPQRQALEAKVEWTGCTVHWVNENLDDGRALKQARLKIEPGDTEESLSQRLLPLEHETYVQALIDLAKNQVS